MISLRFDCHRKKQLVNLFFSQVGERGVSLSGGQRARLGLARAVYAQVDLYLLDDPLAAVDAHVGAHIFNKVIGPSGLLKNKARVLVTHGVTFLPQCDHIVVMEEGTVKEQGTYDKLSSKESGHLARLMEEHSLDEDQNKNAKTNKECERKKRNISPVGNSVNKEDNDVGANEPLLGFSDENEEAVKTGRVGLGVYGTYLRALGPGGCLASMVTLVLAMVAMAGTDWWLKIWTDSGQNKTLDTTINDIRASESDHLNAGSNISKVTFSYMSSLAVYGSLGFAQSAMFMLYSLAIIFTGLRASKTLHKNMLSRLVKCPMVFFERTPLGRVINRFGKDIDACDSVLPETLKQLLMRILKLVTLSMIVVVILPNLLLVVLIVGGCFLLLQQCIVRSLRQLQRLDSVSRSPIYSHFSESLTGASTIRAFSRTQDFNRKCEELVDLSQRCYYPSMLADQLLLVGLTTLANVVTLAAALVLPSAAPSPGTVGLVLTSCLQLPPLMTDLMRFSAQLETNIVAVERIAEYSGLEQETDCQSDEGPSVVSSQWPKTGRVEFKSLTLKYKSSSEAALQSFSCTIEAGQKVGVVGRTGAGKSSIAVALFRLVEVEPGSVFIDGVDITTVGLHDLRSRLTIIPQDPTLFAGSLRINLDPFADHSDDQVWRVLEKAHLRDWAIELEGGLDHQVVEGGENLSVGQRQLVCLARALLRQSKVLVMDEATAALDLDTDALIQKTIREEFQDCTVITIAHRVNTIIDSDLVLVLDKGVLVESGDPSELLSESSTLFHGLVKEASNNARC